jgi:hypothetical protein
VINDIGDRILEDSANVIVNGMKTSFDSGLHLWLKDPKYFGHWTSLLLQVGR